MAYTAPRAGNCRREGGYALLAVVFLVSVMILAATVAAPVLLTEGKREKEDELIWRGEQHVRAIKLYFRKFGRFPKSIDDLTQNNIGIHFLRKKYKDPMNSADGEWRLIYVGPGGQLIGSLTKKSIMGIPLGPGATPAAANQPPSPVPNLSPRQRGPANPTGDQNPAPGEEGTGEQGTTDTGAATGQAQIPAPPAPPNSVTDVPALSTDSNGQVFGGSLIGVASKINKSSIKFYKGYGKYREWEFIWDPQAEAAAAGGVAPGAVIPGQTPGGPLVQPQGGPPGPQPAQPNPNPQ